MLALLLGAGAVFVAARAFRKPAPPPAAAPVVEPASAAWRKATPDESHFLTHQAIASQLDTGAGYVAENPFEGMAANVASGAYASLGPGPLVDGAAIAKLAAEILAAQPPPPPVPPAAPIQPPLEGWQRMTK